MEDALDLRELLFELRRFEQDSGLRLRHTLGVELIFVRPVEGVGLDEDARLSVHLKRGDGGGRLERHEQAALARDFAHLDHHAGFVEPMRLVLQGATDFGGKLGIAAVEARQEDAAAFFLVVLAGLPDALLAAEAVDDAGLAGFGPGEEVG